MGDYCPILIKKRFRNTYFNKLGIAILGERGSGKTLQLVLEAHLNNGIIVAINEHLTTTILKYLNIDISKVQIITHKQFINGYTKGLSEPLYIDEIGVLKNKIPLSEYKKILGYTDQLCFELYDRYINGD